MGRHDHGRTRVLRRRTAETGAAAVEFALIMPLLALMLFGIVDYGLYFNNSLSSRTGIREAVRQGVVQTAPAGSCAAPGNFVGQVACSARSDISAIGHTWVKAFYSSWATGQSLTVCSLVRTDGLIGFVPMPNRGYVRARTSMAIEVAQPVPAGPTLYADTLPAGQDWSWCT